MTVFEDLIPEPLPPGVKVLYGTVTGSSPLRVQVDGDPGPLPITPVTTVACTVGDRVAILSHVRADDPQSRARAYVIVGVIGSPGDIVIGGVRYETSGVFDAVTPGAWVVATSPVYATLVELSVPFTPPTGWGFDVHILVAARYATVNVLSQSATTISVGYTQFGNSTRASTTFGWTLVRTS